MYVEAEISTGEDGTERLIDTLSLIDAVMPDVVTSRKQVDSSGKAPIKAEPGASVDSPSAPSAVEGGGVGGGGGGDPMDVDSAIEIPVEKSTVLKGHDSEVNNIRDDLEDNIIEGYMLFRTI